ncbi:MAG TPA: hypothetical protein VLH56_07905 [Dissulfurispiraceae bacterium]|nr:hypothetical protein [Dissulfurispiraceae bacterium]
MYNLSRIFGRILALLALLSLPNSLFAADEAGLFSSNVPPDALIVLDLSGSMNWTPVGETMYVSTGNCNTTYNGPFYGVTNTGRVPCAIPSGSVPKYSTSSCRAVDPNNSSTHYPFYRALTGAYTTDCSRLEIAKRALFSVLDANKDGVIRSTGATDDAALNVRIGYMRFYNCGGNDTGGDYSAGCNSLIRPIGSFYSRIYCGANPGTCTLATAPSGTCIRGESALGGTPLGASLREAKLYLDAHKATDTTASNCRKKFVLFVTDGADTYSCGGSGQETQTTQYQRRRETVAQAKALGDAGYKVFVVGFGADMPASLQNTLNWAAYYGQTDNPNLANAGSPADYPIAASPAPATPILYPAGITSCMTSPTIQPPGTFPCNGTSSNCFATANDPGTASLSGYAYFAASAGELTEALQDAINQITEGTYSFTVASIATARITSEDHLYEASFTPKDDDPFWPGFLKKYNINSDGSVGSVVWDAGDVLDAMPHASRNMKTCTTGCASGAPAMTDFTTAIDPRYLGFTAAQTTERTNVVGYFRGDPAYSPDDWKLGDIWHSNPVVIATPSRFFKDIVDASTPTAFSLFRDANERLSDASGTRVVAVGANDGQFHVFRTFNGAEAFSFIPPNLMPKLKLVAHLTDPSSLPHQYFVDGPVSTADVWLGTGSGTTKSASDWRTMLVFGLGRGVSPDYTWSSSPNCAAFDGVSTVQTFSQAYSASTPHYCGYYAFDFTNTLSPAYKWRINPTAAQAPYLSDPWSKMTIGRVKIGGNEKWVGFIGGGGYEYSCGTTPVEPANRGKGFFVVDMSNGNILWSYTQANNSLMQYSIPAQPFIFDSDNDGFIDSVYVGDLGGNMWRFRFCNAASPAGCNTGSWTGSLLYEQTSTRRPIYTSLTLTRDPNRNVWLYWGTGDKQCPTSSGTVDRFYAIKDTPQVCTSSADCGGAPCQTGRCSPTYQFSHLQNMTLAAQQYNNTSQGFSFAFAGNEKMLGTPVVFGGKVYFTTYAPAATGANLCTQGGTGRLYAFDYQTALGRDTVLYTGVGILSDPQISLNPAGSSAGVYVTASGAGTQNMRTVQGATKDLLDKPRVIFWRDRRVQ